MHSIAKSFSRAYTASHPPPVNDDGSSDRVVLEYRRVRLISFLDHVECELRESRGGGLWNKKNLKSSKNSKNLKSKSKSNSKNKTNSNNNSSSSSSSSSSVSSSVSSSEKGIYLGTVHQSKGLEWKTVFVVSMSDGMFPMTRKKTYNSILHPKKTKTKNKPNENKNNNLRDDDNDTYEMEKAKNIEQIEEERRLAFVAMSRAKRNLNISYYITSTTGIQDLEPSRFIQELNKTCTKHTQLWENVELEKNTKKNTKTTGGAIGGAIGGAGMSTSKATNISPMVIKKNVQNEATKLTATWKMFVANPQPIAVVQLPPPPPSSSSSSIVSKLRPTKRKHRKILPLRRSVVAMPPTSSRLLPTTTSTTSSVASSSSLTYQRENRNMNMNVTAGSTENVRKRNKNEEMKNRNNNQQEHVVVQSSKRRKKKKIFHSQ